MRRLLISVAVLALATASALAQPGHEHEHGQGHGGGGPPGQGEHQGGHQGEHGGPGRGGPGPGMERPAAPAQPQAQMRAPAAPHGGPTNFTNQIQGHQPDQGQGGRARFERERGGPRPNAPVMAAQPPAPPSDRGERERGNRQGRPNSSGGFNRSGNPNDNRAYASRPGNPTFNNGPRRDFSHFRDFHRDFRSARRFRIAPYRPPAGFYVHHWTFGEFLPQPYWVRDYWLLDFADYGLPPPPYGAVWVRVGADALLIDEYSGEIITVAYDVF